MSFDASVRSIDGVAVIDLSGDIDREAEAALDGAYDQAAASSPSAVLLHFGEVGYINSSGIAVIVGMLASARRDRIEVRACGLTEHYQEIFEITRLADFVSIFPDETSAFA